MKYKWWKSDCGLICTSNPCPRCDDRPYLTNKECRKLGLR